MVAMLNKEDFKFTKYLIAKKSVDDKAINLRVWNLMKKYVLLKSSENPIKILEIGGGIGTMLIRLLEGSVLHRCEYTLVDLDSEALEVGKDIIASWCEENKLTFQKTGSGKGEIDGNGISVKVNYIHANIFEYLESNNMNWDLIIGNAVLDLFDPNRAIEKIFTAMKGGNFYFTINYDGETIFEPQIDAFPENHYMELYNQTMDNRIVDGLSSGDSKTGRHLFSIIRDCGGKIVGSGSSDWIVYPQDSIYPEEEKYFLLYILQTIYQALKNTSFLDLDELIQWLSIRQSQVEKGELVYIAHQYDFFGEVL